MELDLNHFYIETRRHCAFKFPTFMILCETLGLRSLVKNRTKNGGYFINLSSQLLDFINVLQSVQFSHWVVSSSLRPRGLQHARLPCPSPTPRACSVSCWLSRWCHPTILSSVVPFSSCLLSKHQGLFQWVSSSHQVAKILELQHQFFQWIFRTDFFYDWLFWSPCSPRDSQESSPTIEFKSINS